VHQKEWGKCLYGYVHDTNGRVDPFGLIGFTPNQQAVINDANSLSNKGKTKITNAQADDLLKRMHAANAEHGVTTQVKVLDHRFNSGNNSSPGHYKFGGTEGHIHIHNKHIGVNH